MNKWSLIVCPQPARRVRVGSRRDLRDDCRGRRAGFTTSARATRGARPARVRAAHDRQKRVTLEDRLGRQIRDRSSQDLLRRRSTDGVLATVRLELGPSVPGNPPSRTILRRGQDGGSPSGGRSSSTPRRRQAARSAGPLHPGSGGRGSRNTWTSRSSGQIIEVHGHLTPRPRLFSRRAWTKFVTAEHVAPAKDARMPHGHNECSCATPTTGACPRLQLRHRGRRAIAGDWNGDGRFHRVYRTATASSCAQRDHQRDPRRAAFAITGFSASDVRSWATGTRHRGRVGLDDTTTAPCGCGTRTTPACDTSFSTRGRGPGSPLAALEQRRADTIGIYVRRRVVSSEHELERFATSFTYALPPEIPGWKGDGTTTARLRRRYKSDRGRVPEDSTRALRRPTFSTRGRRRGPVPGD